MYKSISFYPKRLSLLMSVLLAFSLILPELAAQLPYFGHKVLLHLPNPNGDLAIQVEAYKQYAPDGQNKDGYLFMPPSSAWRVPMKSNGFPNFILLAYTGTKRLGGGNDCNEEEGAVMHLGVTYGFTDAQIQRLEAQLKESAGPKAFFAGYVPLTPARQTDPVQLTASLTGNDSLTMTTNGLAPTSPGDVTVVSAHFGATDAVLLRNAFSSGGSLISLRFAYEATFMANIVDGEIIFNFNRTDTQLQTLDEKYRKKHRLGLSVNAGITSWRSVLKGIKVQSRHKISMKETRRVYEFLKEEKMIEFRFAGSGAEAAGAINEQELKAIKDAAYEHLFKVFVSEFTTATPPKGGGVEDPQLKSRMDLATKDKSVVYFKSSQRYYRSTTTQKKDVRKINITLPVTYPLYRSYTVAVKPTKPVAFNENAEDVDVQDIPAEIDDNFCATCISVVPICDETFERRVINASLDGTLEMLLVGKSKMINYINIELRNGKYLDKVTLNADNFNELGGHHQFRYSRYGRSENAFYPYEYRYTISFNSDSGHKTFQSDWVREDKSDLTVAAPFDLSVEKVNPKIRVAAEFDSLKQLGVKKIIITGKDTYLSKSRKHLKTINIGSPWAEPKFEWLLPDTGSKFFEYQVAFLLTGGKTLYAEPGSVEWGGDIYLDGELPEEARDESNPWLLKSTELLPDIPDRARKWLELLTELVNR